MAVIPTEVPVALFDGASVGGARGEVAQAAHLATVVKGPGPGGKECLEQLLEVALLVVGHGEHCLLEHGTAGCGDRGRYCLPLFGQRDRGGAGVCAAAAAAGKATLVEPVEQADDRGMGQLQTAAQAVHGESRVLGELHERGRCLTSLPCGTSRRDVHVVAEREDRRSKKIHSAIMCVAHAHNVTVKVTVQSTHEKAIMPRPPRLTPGLLAGTGAGLVWGLAFLVPVLLPGWSAVAVTAGRYLAYGILSLALLVYEGRAAWRLTRQHWRAALAFAVTGNVGYYLLLVIGIQKIGAPITDTIIGSIPVVVAVVSNWHAPALPWRRLVLPVALSLAGLALINAVEFTGTHPSVAAPLGARLIGLAAAVAAVALWTWYALANARFLGARPGIAARSWSSVVGLATLVVTFAALLPVTFLGHTSWSAVSRRDAAMFLAGIALLGVAVAWGGTWLWNTASARLPTTTAGLLINVETVSGYVYVYLARHQWPPPGQLLGFALILAGVGLALTRGQTPAHPASIACRTGNPSHPTA